MGGLTKREIAEWLRAAKKEDPKVLEKAREWLRAIVSPNRTSPLRYSIEFDERDIPIACTCPQFRFRKKPCKHMVAAFLLNHRKEISKHSRRWREWFEEMDKEIEREIERKRKEQEQRRKELEEILSPEF